jgi:hypothetical protein
MPKPEKHPKRPHDVNQWARQTVRESTHQEENVSPDTPSSVQAAIPTPAQISAFMAEMGRKGGKIGGKRRLVTLSPERRRELAYKAAKARWGKTSGNA